jgi:hypothetical protein
MSGKPYLRAVRQGLESLTVTGPSPALEAMRREALEAVGRRPSRLEREAATDRTLSAQSVEEMWDAAKEAIRAAGG